MPAIKYKCLFFIVDGLGDLPVPQLNGRTPLEAAVTPNLDRLAAAGQHGLLDPIAPNIAASTHSGTGILLGMPAADAEKLRRGPVEAAGAGRPIRRGEVVLRANFATVRSAFGGFIVSDRRAGRISEEVHKLADAIRLMDLGDGVKAEFQALGQHRGLLVLSGEGLDPAVSDTDPGDDELPAPVLRCQPLTPAARRTADKINVWIKKVNAVLEGHLVNLARAAAGKPVANGVVTRGAGAHIPTRNLVRDAGLSGALISACNTVQGLGRAVGYEVITDTRFTADEKTDLDAKFEAAAHALQQHDIVFVHIKAPDVCAHDCNPAAKRDFLTRLDLVLAPLVLSKVVTAVAADHTTDSNTGRHTADPVPALFYSPDHGAGILGIKFGEEACRRGTMDRQTSAAFLQRVMAAMHGGLS